MSSAPNHHETHGLAAVGSIEQLRLRAGPARRRRQVAVAGDPVAAAVGHTIEDAVFRCHRQQVQRGIRQIDLPLAINKCNRIGDGQRRGHQQVVVGPIGGALAVIARSEQQRHREHRQQCTEVQQQRAPQRPRCGIRCARVNHRRRRCRHWLPADSRRRAPW
ncbi:hypothetical protein G6F64_013917 [Rhizopus arrhizus]|uniref:Uncharacterized protein n=1 Tax=Rhizopus oryzae TaxID=64495 RepID=A0A9P6WUK3_RHIOR|nr:hypothetical protein G6F64_013917 [Rhizopus arrhizus]